MTCKVFWHQLASTEAAPQARGAAVVACRRGASGGSLALVLLRPGARHGGPPLAQLRRHAVRGVRGLARPGLRLRLHLRHLLLVEVLPGRLGLVLRGLRLLRHLVLLVELAPG